MKYLNFKRYKFSTIVKNLHSLVDYFLRYFKFINYKKILSKLNESKYNLNILKKWIKPAKYGLDFKFKIPKFKDNKFIYLHLPTFIFFFTFLYLLIPIFYNYDKKDIEKKICNNNNIKCIVKGKIYYNFFPTPRIVVKDLKINLTSKDKTFITIKETYLKLSYKNLLDKKMHKVKKIKFNKFDSNLNLLKLKQYKNIVTNKNDFIPLVFNDGNILLSDKTNQVLNINNVNINLNFKKKMLQTNLKGKILDDNIIIKYNVSEAGGIPVSNVEIKMPTLNIYSQSTFSYLNKVIKSGKFSIKINKNKFSGIFDYKDSKFNINKSNIRNYFADGKVEGDITLLPYFDFNLDLDLNSMSFTKLYNYFLSLDENKKKTFFKINNKMNGKLNLSAEKIYSKHNLVKSFESRMNFYNGNIKIDQFLINLGKLGAADIVGNINNDKEFSRFKFDSNVFADNQKKFLRKFGIYDKDKLSSLFISGNFDFEKIKINFYDISTDDKFKFEDVNFIESEFNDIMLEDGYNYLFDFMKFKVFLKSLRDDIN